MQKKTNSDVIQKFNVCQLHVSVFMLNLPLTFSSIDWLTDILQFVKTA